MTAPSAAKLKAACRVLADADVALAKAYAAHGLPVWRSAKPEYATLARTVAYQQITTKAAGTIWGRVQDFLGDVTPETALSATSESLRNCGLSRPKVSHLTSIAEAIVSGQLNLARVCAAPLDEARKELIAVNGIGPWTAELFLLYAVGEMDAFPTGDVGLMQAHMQLSVDATRMTSKAFSTHADMWRPYRGVAAHLLWGWLNDQRAAAMSAR